MREIERQGLLSMSSVASTWGLYTIMFLGGVGISTMAALNRAKGDRFISRIPNPIWI